MLILCYSLSSPNNSDESVHADVGGSFIQSENTSGHLRVSQWKAPWCHQVCVCVCVFNHKSAYTDVSLCHGPDSLLIRTGGRRGCREKWPPESTRTLMGRSPFRVTTFWCPAERHTRRRSPALPPTTRRSSLTASPSMFSVSLSHTWLKVHN